MYFAVCCLTMF